MFTNEEVKVAKATRDTIIKANLFQLKSIYMAGEIVMWDELQQTDVSGSLPSQELIEILRECRDLLVMCTLIDKSGQCKSLVDKVDAKMGWQ